MINFNIITLLPEVFVPFLENLPLKRALLKENVQVNLVNLRDFALNDYGTVDDKPYGGGTGMVLMIEPIYKALNSIYNTNDFLEYKKALPANQRIIVTAPSGKTYSQNYARELSKMQDITIICGRYEGIDSRVGEHLATDTISIGNFVLSGGELPALTIMESIVRLLPGTIEKESALETESFNENLIEYPQFTRPEDFKGMKVPEVLLSGNHAEIQKWRTENMPNV